MEGVFALPPIVRRKLIMKKKKIRVVSIILLAAMFLSLLPAEQVFATEDSSKISWDYSRLGFWDKTEDMKILQIIHGSGDPTVYVNTGDATDSTEGLHLGSNLYVGSEADGPLNILGTGNTNLFKHYKDIYDRYQDDNGDEICAAFEVTTGTTPFVVTPEADGVFKLNTDFNSWFPSLESDLYRLGFISGSSNLYAVTTIWGDNKWSDIQTSVDSDWYWQRITCDYNVEEDVFVYTLVSYMNRDAKDKEEGNSTANVITLAQHKDKRLFLYGLVPFASYKERSCDTLNNKAATRMVSQCVTGVKSWYSSNKENVIGGVRLLLNGSREGQSPDSVYLNNYNDESQIDSSKEVNVLTQAYPVDNGEIKGAPWVSTAGEDYFIGLALTNSITYDAMRKDTTYGNTVRISAKETSNSVDLTADIRVSGINIAVTLFTDSDYEGEDPDDNDGGVAGKNSSHEYYPKGGEDFIKIIMGSSSMKRSIQSADKLSNDDALSEDGYIKLETAPFSVTDSQAAWNVSAVTNVDYKGDSWCEIFYRAYCKHLAILADIDKGANSAFKFKQGKPLEEELKPISGGAEIKIHGQEGYEQVSSIFLSQDALYSLSKQVDKIDYKSDVGVKVQELLEKYVKDGLFEISYEETDSLVSTLDWKAIAESEKSFSKLHANSVTDIMYAVLYLYNMHMDENSALNINAIKVNYPNENVVYIAFPGGELDKVRRVTSAGSYTLSDGRVFYTRDSAPDGWTYYCSPMQFLQEPNLLVPKGKEDSMYFAKHSVRQSMTKNGQLTSEELLNVMPKLITEIRLTTVTSYKECDAPDMLYGLDADDYSETAQRIETTSDSNNYTGTVFGCLTDANHMYTYSTELSRGYIGEGSLDRVPADVFYSSYVGTPYRRDDRLEGSQYTSDPNSKVDYLARVPILNGTILPDNVYTILYNIDYAASVCDWSTYSEETGIDASTMSKFLNSNSSSDYDTVATDLFNKIRSVYDAKNGSVDMITWAEAGVYDNMSEDYICILRSIISIHDICDTLREAELYTSGDYSLEVISDMKDKGTLGGVEVAKRWSPAIYKYYIIFEQNSNLFNAMRGNLLKVVGGDFSYSTSIEPLGFVIKFEDEMLSAQWKYGYALSSMYVPFETNLYEASAVEFMADKNNWVTEFFYKYGFYRKALYISTDPEAVVSKYIQGQQSGVKVATLRDLLNYQRDIELYVDQSFYNSKLLEAQLDRYIQNTGDNSMFGSIFDACNLTSDAILKTGGYSNYSSSVQQNVRPFNYEMTDEEEANIKEIFEYEDFILSEEEIVGADGMLSAYEYSIQQPYGLVSALYRHAKGYDYANMASVNNKPIFVSSKNASALGANNKELYRMFYNYMILSSLEATMSKETTLLVDLDAPIYTDLFGNIITSDGYVIIPAACNATLSGAYFKPYSIGFSVFVNNVNPEIYKDMTFDFYDFFYGINYASAIGKKNVSDYSPKFRSNQQMIGGGYFFLTQSGETTLGTTSLTDGMATTTVDWRNPNTNVAALKDLLFSVHYMNTTDMYNTTTVNLILEVLRGAPIEHIDVVAEGLETSRELTKLNATAAYMSEKLINSFQTNSNGTERSAKFSATLSVLDLFHIESAEKVALIAVKCLLVIFLILLAVQIVADASVGRMPIKTVWQTIVTCILTGTCIALLPVLTEFSLSTFTRMIMQQEASELLAFSTQRETDGTEIGVTQSYNTNSSTNIILHAGQLDVQWYDLLLYSVYSSVDDSFQDLYNKAADGMPLAEAPYTFTSGKEIYIDVNKVMDTTVVQYNGELKLITNERAATKTDNDLTASYILPYYVFLDQLIANVNYYNERNRVQPMNYSVNSDGSIRTHDMVYGYFHSEEFMSTDYDVLDLYRILNVNSHKVSYCPYFTDDEVSTFMNSQWYPASTNSDAIEKGINDLYAKAREYVMYNSSMLSYTTDAAFLKSMAMYLAVEYNNLFGVKTADAFELKCVDTKDLLRYVVGTPVDVYKYANRSFSRYAFENGGLASVCLATLLYCIFGLTNGMKVVAYVLTYITAIASIIYHRIFKREENYTTYGFFILIGEITVLNLVFAICFKVMMNLTRWGVPPIIAMLISIVMQILIIVGYTMIGINGAKNVKHLGQTEMAFFHNVMNHFSGSRSKSNASGEGAERTVAVLQAHDLTRRENDNFNEDRADPMDLMAHDRRRERGEIES